MLLQARDREIGGAASAARARPARQGSHGRQMTDRGFEIAEGRKDLPTMAADFIFSPEFQSLADADQDGSLGNLEFIDHMFLNVFGREPDEGGLLYWLNELAAGNRSQADVLVEMTQSNEYVEQTVIADRELQAGIVCCWPILLKKAFQFDVIYWPRIDGGVCIPHFMRFFF